MIDPVQIVLEKEKSLKEAHKEPAMILLTEVLNTITERAKQELREAVKSGKLECHTTLNDVVFNSKQ